MYDKLNTYILSFPEENDFWYDVGAVRATEMISEFTQIDWDDFNKEIASKATDWKRKFAYCLESGHNINELLALLIMIDTDDEDLFEICVDSLRGFINAENKQLILSNKTMLEQINMQKNKTNPVLNAILTDFSQKLNSLQ